MKSILPKVAIIGRPNVGKSTLFNRLVGKQLALVHDIPGVTRDRRESNAKLGDLKFNIIDTAGLDDTQDDELSTRMWEQTLEAIKSTDIILFVIDARAGVTGLDEHFANIVRKANKPVVLVANKAEKELSINIIGESAKLGLGDIVGISAAHGQGLVDLFDSLKNYFDVFKDNKIIDDKKDETNTEKALQMAIIGRPNVGKSTLINYLLDEDRLLTADYPGVTRDSISVDWSYKGRNIKLVDTAGMRRKSNIKEKLEKLSVKDGLRAVQYAQITILILDHETPLAKQDAVIANRAIEEGRILIIAINKWDLITNKEEYIDEIRYKLSKTLTQVKGIPCIPISAKTGKNVEKLLDQTLDVYDLWNTRVPTAKLNKWLENIVSYHPPPIVGRSRLRIKYISQIKTRPPTFILFTSKSKDVPDSYIRYLLNDLRETFKLPGVPIRISVKSSENPYKQKK